MRPMTPEDVFRTANSTSNFTAKPQKTGFQLQFNGKRVGGWVKKSHWYVLNPFASSAHENYEAILNRFGFKQQPRHHRWWKLKGEAQAASFCCAVAELTGEGFYLAMPGEEPPVTYAEGHVAIVYVNRFERDPRNRRAAIEKHGDRCLGCNLSLQDRYGAIAEGFIHIHHTKPLATLRESNIPDLDDLIPLCPNCHAVVHLQDPPLTIDQLRKRIDSTARLAEEGVRG